MHREYDDLSFNALLNLYKLKIQAERKNDKSAITNLKERYPELFSKDFANFINDLKDTIAIIKITTGKDFTEMLAVEEDFRLMKMGSAS